LLVRLWRASSSDYIGAKPVKQFSKRHIRESPRRTNSPTVEQVHWLVAEPASNSR